MWKVKRRDIISETHGSGGENIISQVFEAGYLVVAILINLPGFFRKEPEHRRHLLQLLNIQCFTSPGA